MYQWFVDEKSDDIEKVINYIAARTKTGLRMDSLRRIATRVFK